MIRAARYPVISAVILSAVAVPSAIALLTAFAPPPGIAQAQGPVKLDTSTLPRTADAKLTYAGPASTIFTTAASVEKTAEAVAVALTTAGWQPYNDALSARAKTPAMQMLSFKRGPHAILAYVTVAPAQGNATSVTYSGVPLANDLPFPKDAANVEFSPDRPLLRCTSGEAVLPLMDFFRKEFAALSYQPWTGRPPHKSDKNAVAFFTRDNQNVLVVSLTRRDDERTRVDISSATAKALMPQPETQTSQAESAERTSARVAAQEEHERIAQAFEKQVNTLVDQVLTEVQQQVRAAQPAQREREMPAPAMQQEVASAPSIEFAADDLLPEDVGGYPVPKRRTVSGTEKTQYRTVLNASVPMDLSAVLGFYRSELRKMGWAEQAEGSSIDGQRATIAFKTPEGPASITIERVGEETRIKLVQRKQQAAQNAGIAPKPGQAKMILGNPNEADAIVSIANKTFKIKAGAGAKRPDGPSMDLAPGKYRVSLKLAGKPAETETIELGADETWGLLIGPGGLLPLHVY